jgi:hypothetical protein
LIVYKIKYGTIIVIISGNTCILDLAKTL